MYQDQHGLPRQFYKEQCKEGEEGADKRSVGRIISEWTGLRFCSALREAENKIKGGKGLLCPWCPTFTMTTG